MIYIHRQCHELRQLQELSVTGTHGPSTPLSVQWPVLQGTPVTGLEARRRRPRGAPNQRLTGASFFPSGPHFLRRSIDAISLSIEVILNHVTLTEDIYGPYEGITNYAYCRIDPPITRPQKRINKNKRIGEKNVPLPSPKTHNSFDRKGMRIDVFYPGLIPAITVDSNMAFMRTRGN